MNTTGKLVKLLYTLGARRCSNVQTSGNAGKHLAIGAGNHITGEQQEESSKKRPVASAGKVTIQYMQPMASPEKSRDQNSLWLQILWYAFIEHQP